MKNKKGVSLITLIVTIVIMIILAGTVILSFKSTNTIGKANEAKFKQNVSNYQDELNNYIAEQTLSNYTFNSSGLNLYGTDVKRAITSMSDVDTQIFSVVAGKLTVNEDADDDYKLWAAQIGVDVTGEIPVSSAPSTTSAPATSAPVTSAPATSAPPVSVAPSGEVISSLTIAQIRASISADTRPGYTQVGTTNGGSPVYSSTMTRVAQQYYGKAVAYSANGIDSWQIFYIDSNNVYLISTDYIPYNKLPGYDSATTSGDMTKGGNDYKAYFNSSTSMKTEISETNKMIARGYMPQADMNVFGLNTSAPSSGKYVAKTGETLNENFKSALYLLDETKWTSFVNGAQKGEVAYGGPTARMIVASTNEYWGTNVAVSAGAKTGYRFSGYVNGGNGICYYWPVTTNSMYTLPPDKANGYWIAGPTAYSTSCVLGGDCNSSLCTNTCTTPGFRVSHPSFSKL